MKIKVRITLLSFLIIFVLSIALAADYPTIQELLEQAGIKPQGDMRGQYDIIGFTSTAMQMDQVFPQCGLLAAPRQKELAKQYSWDEATSFIAAVCPHDDYYYAGRLYSLVLSRIHAKRVILLGVFHKARIFECQDRLVFDSYQYWHAPNGKVKVSSLREEIIKHLPIDDYIIDSDMHMVEHSLEAITPFLQAYNREVEIVPILVPHMGWETLNRLAEDFAQALADICLENDWRLGDDVSLVCSSDAVHYGDADWGGFNYAPYGTDIQGYQTAVEKEMELVELLCGSLDGEKLRDFMLQCVDEKDVYKYNIPWCGRFSVPFGLNVAYRLTEALESRLLEGVFLDYGSSLSEASLNLEGLEPMGVTAPNNLHHWVGYAAIGYK